MTKMPVLQKFKQALIFVNIGPDKGISPFDLSISWQRASRRRMIQRESLDMPAERSANCDV
ncbi:MAG: hypothetical protein BGO59_05700 [Spirosoma sp. 48-14]|nr:MAG: hypothetical protein BGO59_05700 [Spirosoma sp. 48-14]